MTGRWIERTPSYLSFDIYNCAYCGKNVPRSIWIEEIGGDPVPFCSEAVAEVYRSSRTHPGNGRRPDAALPLTEELRAVRRACAALRDRSIDRSIDHRSEAEGAS